ncbi:MAG: methyltransferase domain-containing protein [bacterium]|nr:methyltransferase domain-containing protein [bacterium]
MASKIQILHEEVSPISGKIKVRQYYDVRELYVDGVKQSMWSDNVQRFEGTYWDGVLSVPLPEVVTKPRVLMLGAGGGTIPKLFSQKYPASDVISIELDPVIIKVSKDFFDLDNFPNIKIIEDDANRWLEKNNEIYRNYFDVICLDTYISDNFNFNTKNRNKIQNIIHYLSGNGTLITNRIYTDENNRELSSYKKELSNYFSSVNEIIIAGFSGLDNLLIYAQSPLAVN